MKELDTCVKCKEIVNKIYIFNDVFRIKQIFALKVNTFFVNY